MTSHVPTAATLETAAALTPELLRAWAWHRQGLDGTLEGRTSQEVLASAGSLKDFRACVASVRRLPKKGISIDREAAGLLEIDVGDTVQIVSR